jgi:hypothetical protein
LAFVGEVEDPGGDEVRLLQGQRMGGLLTGMLVKAYDSDQATKVIDYRLDQPLPWP